MVLDGDRVVAATTTLRLDFDFEHGRHSFEDIIQGGWLTSHQPEGAWLYGADIGGVDPQHRGKGLSTALYAARQEVVWKYGLLGQVTAGMFPGYAADRTEMSVEEYYRRVVEKTIWDPTLSVQMKLGFEPRGLLKDYLLDPVCDNYSVLLVLNQATNIGGASRESAMGYIRLQSSIPGPRAKEMLARRAAAVPSGLGRSTDVVVERADGGWSTTSMGIR